MTKAKSKKQQSLLFIGVFVVIIVIMIVANLRKTVITELVSPPGGIENLYTINGRLVCISNANEIYLWDWGEIEAKPEIKIFSAEKLLLSHSDNLVMIPSGKLSVVSVSDIRTGTTRKKVRLMSGWKYSQLAQSRNGGYVTIAETKGIEGDGRIRLERFSEDFEELKNITIIEEKGFAIYGIAVSDDGAFIVLAGMKDKRGWVVMVSADKRKKLWSKNIPDSSYLTDAVFDMSSKNIFVGGEGKCLFQIETATGAITRQFKIESKVDQSFNEPRVTAVKISPDGNTIAACINPDNAVKFWDNLSGEHIETAGGSKGLNSIVFSPDSSMFLTAGRVHGGAFKVRKVPK